MKDQTTEPKSMELCLAGAGETQAAPLNPLPPDAASQLSTVNPQPVFPRLPGETPRAFGAFRAFFALGQSRSLQAVADQLGEKPTTVKYWSSKFQWNHRIQSFNSGLLQQQAEAEAAARLQQAADWARRTREFREQACDAAQKLFVAAQCFLESVGEREVEEMNLGQASRAVQIAARTIQEALSGTRSAEEPALAPVQMEMNAALKRAYRQPAPGSGHANAGTGSSDDTSKH